MPSEPRRDPAPSPEESAAPLEERAGLLERLRFGGRRRRVPYVQALAATDCGAACLAMTLGYHGKEVRLDQVRDLCVTSGRDGASALGILDAARWFGMRGHGVSIQDLDDLDYLEPGAILHWGFNHFVVYERRGRGWVDIVDPSFGRRRVPLAEFGKAFTGVALLLEPGEGWSAETRVDHPVRRYLKQILGDGQHWSRIVVLSAMLQVFALALPILTGAVVDRVVPRGDRHLLLVVGAGVLALVVFHFVSSIIRSHLLLHLRTWLDARMTLGFLDHLMDLPYDYFQRRPAGDLMMRMNSNTTIREILTSSVLSGLLDGTMAFLYLIAIFAMSAGMGLVVLALAGANVLVYVTTRRRQRELMAQSLATQAAAQSYQFEMLSGIETLKAMGGEHRAVEHWTDLYVDTLNVSLDRGRLEALASSVGNALRLLAPLVILGYGALQVLDGDLSLGTMLGLAALGNGFLGPLGSLVQNAMQLQLLGGYVERIDDVLQTPPEQDRAQVRPAPALVGRITLEDVSFRYGPTAPLVVKGVSVDVQPGQFVAIVGRSGSGKSTLAALMAALYRPTEGRILYDGQDLAELSFRSVRRQLGIVAQRPYLFGRSIRANIALGEPDLPLAEVVAAARLACVHEEIAAMPLGYETILVDGGASLSGGQRQRVALARALARKPRLLLLDEATSALDAVTELAVQRQLATLGCTRIVIAHRLSTIVDADLILVMEDGVIVERGRHAELMARGGAYARLVEAQVR